MWYIAMFAVLIAAAIVGCVLTTRNLTISRSAIIAISVVFMFVLAVTLIYITYRSIEEEEVIDSYKLADLQNRIKRE